MASESIVSGVDSGQSLAQSQSFFDHFNISGSARVHVGHNYAQAAPSSRAEKRAAAGVPFTVPFGRDTQFVPRSGIIDDLMACLHSEEHSRMALVGMGGVGKTQIAIEFAYALRTVNPDVAIYWVYAGSSERIRDSYRQIGNALDLPGIDNGTSDVLKIVSDHLSDYRNGRWLIIIDNADDTQPLEAVGKRADETLASCVPQTSGCAALITSRDRKIALDFVGDWSEPLSVNVMDESQALSLLENKLRIAALRTGDQRELLDELGWLPLAITQAAAYMRRYNMSTTTYLRYLRNSVLIGRKPGRGYIDTRRDRDQINAVNETLFMSFDRLTNEDPAAARLLKLMSCFDRQGIPKTYFYEPEGSKNERMEGYYMAEPEFFEAIGILESLALIESDVSGTSSKMHRLVRSAVQDWISRHDEGFEIVSTARMLIAAQVVEFSNSTVGQWNTRRTIMIHIQALFEDMSALRYLNDGAAAADDTTESRRFNGTLSMAVMAALPLMQSERYAEAKQFLLSLRTFAAGRFQANTELMTLTFGLLFLCSKELNEYETLEAASWDFFDQWNRIRADSKLLDAEALTDVCHIMFGITPEIDLEIEKMTRMDIERLEEDYPDSEEAQDLLVEYYGAFALILAFRFRTGRQTQQEEFTRLGNQDEPIIKDIEKYAGEAIALVAGKAPLTVPRFQTWLRGQYALALLAYFKGDDEHAELLARRHLCGCVNLKILDSGQKRSKLMQGVMKDLNAITKALGKEEVDYDAFEVEHEDCELGLDGCYLDALNTGEDEGLSQSTASNRIDPVLERRRTWAKAS